MISDKQRRVAVDELRRAAAGEYRHVDALDVVAGAVGVDIDGKYLHDAEETVYGALANFIDRPTCRNVADPDDGSSFECSRCGEKWEMTCGSPADNHLNHYPNCGAEVTDDA